MDKEINQLSNKLKSLFNKKEIDQLARETGFIKRKSKMTPEIFMALCIFHGEALCTDSLVQIHAQLKEEEGFSKALGSSPNRQEGQTPDNSGTILTTYNR